MKTKRINDEVIAVDESVALLSREQVREIVAMAAKTPRKRMRICVHRDDAEKHQEMFIVHTDETYVRPHRHLTKAESFQVLEGEVDVVFFDDKGNVTKTVSMGDYASGRPFYYRIAEPVYHSLLIRSKHLLFKESTTGPFIRSESEFAPWAPEEKDADAVREFTAKLRQKIGKSSHP